LKEEIDMGLNSVWKVMGRKEERREREGERWVRVRKERAEM